MTEPNVSNQTMKSIKIRKSAYQKIRLLAAVTGETLADLHSRLLEPICDAELKKAGIPQKQKR